MLQRLALGVVDDFKLRLKLVPLCRTQVLQNHVLPELKADDFGFGMLGQQGHKMCCMAARIAAVEQYTKNREN